MAVLINQEGKVFVDTNLINSTLSPAIVGHFDVSKSTKAYISKNLTNENDSALFSFIPEDRKKHALSLGLQQTRAGIFQSTSTSTEPSRSSASQTPHINEGNEIHFFLAGGHIICFQIDESQFSLVVGAGDWLFIPKDLEHWTQDVEDRFLAIASFHSEPFDVFHKKVSYTNTQKKTFI